MFLSLTRSKFILAFVLLIVPYFLQSGSAPLSAQSVSRSDQYVPSDRAWQRDHATDAIRDRRKEFFRVQTPKPKDRLHAAEYGAIVSEHGSFVIVAKPKRTRFSKALLVHERLETSINLPGATFDPLEYPLSEPRPYAADKSYFIAQFGGVVKDEWLSDIRDIGGEVVQYVPHSAFIVYADGETASRISQHFRVRWIGEYRAEFKLAEHFERALAKKPEATGTFDVAVFARADVKQMSVVLGGYGNVVSSSDLPNNFFNIIRVEMKHANVESVAELPDVFSIEPASSPMPEDERSSQIIAGNYTSSTQLSGMGYDPQNQFGADGTDVTVAVVDDGVLIPGRNGLYITTQNAINGPSRGTTPGNSTGHGHLNASIIAGAAPFGTVDLLGYNYGLGVAPKTNVVNIPFLKPGYLGSYVDTVNDALLTNGPNGIAPTIINNSWGTNTNENAYGTLEAQYDGYVRDASVGGSIDPVTIVFSAGNCGQSPGTSACGGESGLTRPKVAKNVIAVGNSENLRPELGSIASNNIDDLSPTSSRGPAADGRVKPDIIAPGNVIAGGASSGTSGVFGTVPGDSNHAYSGGTSHAAAQVSGAAALFVDYWKASHLGMNPSPALVKASIISSAQEMIGANADVATIPNGSEGWGRINMKMMMNTGVSMRYNDQQVTFAAAGETHQINGILADATKPLRVSLVWTDPPGIADPSLVNDLDLTLTIGGTIYKGNVFANGSSVSGGNADRRNNVENIFLPAGIAAGTPVSISVSAAAINGDGVLGNSDATDQHFALVVFNARGTPEAGAASVTTGNSILEPNECNLLTIPITNNSDTTATAVSATLSTSTPGVTIFRPNANYPDIAPGATQNNLLPFQISTDNTVACLSTVNLTLTINYSGGLPVVSNTTLPVGSGGMCNAGFGQCVLTAAGVEVAGRVVSADGRGVRNALVSITNSASISRSTATNTFGYFRFESMKAGESYVLSARVKGYTFQPILLNVEDKVHDLSIVAAP